MNFFPNVSFHNETKPYVENRDFFWSVYNADNLGD